MIDFHGFVWLTVACVEQGMCRSAKSYRLAIAFSFHIVSFLLHMCDCRTNRLAIVGFGCMQAPHLTMPLSHFMPSAINPK